MQDARVAFGSWTTTVAIIGESHFVCVADSDRVPVAAELLACVDPTICGVDPTAAKRCGIEPCTLDADDGSVSVRSTLTLHRHRDDGWVLPAPSRSESGIALVHSFPGTRAPRTFVGVRLGGRAPIVLRISSLHEYVDDRSTVVVASETTMTFREGA